MWHLDTESKIVEHGRRKEYKDLAKYRQILVKKHIVSDYMLTRFMDEHGELLGENEKADTLYDILSEEYRAVTRLLTILDAYDR